MLHLRLRRPSALFPCSKALSFDENCVKALYRRAQVYKVRTPRPGAGRAHSTLRPTHGRAAELRLPFATASLLGAMHSTLQERTIRA